MMRVMEWFNFNLYMVFVQVYVGTPVDKCREINRNALANDLTDSDDGGKGHGYEESVFENLVYRYEEPNGMNRWDSPLFTVLHDDVDPPYDQIWDALIETDGRTKALRPNQATVLVIFSSSLTLHQSLNPIETTA